MKLTLRDRKLKRTRRRLGEDAREQRRSGMRGILSKMSRADKLGIANLLLTRSPFGGSETGIDQNDRDLDEECGYPTAPTVELYRQLYEREGIATRVVDVYPDECWSVYPEIYETEEKRRTAFERRWDVLEEEIDILHNLHRVDMLSGIGHFGILVLGLGDNKPLNTPARGVDRFGGIDRKSGDFRQKLIYLMPFSEDLVRIVEYEKKTDTPRHGQPLMYSIKMSDPRHLTSTSMHTQTGDLRDVEVHWTRVLHVADNRKSSNVFGTPRMKAVLNRIYDVRKVLGSSAEMFWKGGFPGYTFEAYPDLTGESELDEESLEEQIEDYVKGLKRYMASVGGKFVSLAPQVADPTNHVVQQIDSICATLGVPRRIFMGAEAGHLASTQDAGTWNRRLGRRQRMYITPKIIRPFVRRLVALRVLPEPEGIIVNWRDLNVQSDLDKAKVGLLKAQTLMQFVTGACESAMPLHEMYTHILGLNPDEAAAVMKAVGANKKLFTEKGWKSKTAAPQGGGRNGKAPKSPPGRRATTVAKA